jgi:predicted DNA-binding protein (MmcQ/YjbR family)
MMLDTIRQFCLSLQHTEEGMPFGDDVLVFKVKGKMYALCGIIDIEFINLKCDPEHALELRAQYEAIEPGYHMSKAHWNSVYFHRDLKWQQIQELIEDSYRLVVASLPKKDRFDF